MQLRERPPSLWKQRGYIGIGNRRVLNGQNWRQKIAALLDGAPLNLSNLTHSAIPVRGDVTPSFTRATVKCVQNNDGYMVTLLAGELGFPGARRIRNHLRFTNDLTNAVWTKINGGTGTVPVVTAGQTDPNGGTTAFRVQANSGASATGADYSVVRQVLSSTTANLRWIYIKSNTGAPQTIYFGAPANNQSITATMEWQQMSAPLLGGHSAFDIGAYPGGGSGMGGATCDVLVWHPQAEDVTAQVTQIAREHVSSDVESAPYYHGSMVDGVKCFPTDLSGNPLTTMAGYKPEPAATNLCLQSNAFTTTWTTSGTVTSAQNAGGPSGAANEAWTLGDTDAAVLSDVRQEFVIANDAVLRGYQIRVGKTVGAATFPGVGVLLLGGTTVAGQWAVNTNLGTLTARSSNVGTVAATIESAGNFWIIKMSATNNSTGNVTARIQMFPSVNADASATWVASTVGNAVFACAGFEVGWPSSYIATTTVAVTRDADNLTYSGGDIPNLKTLCATFKRESGVESVGWAVALSDGTISNYESISAVSATQARFLGVTGGATQWDVIPSYTAGTTSKAAFSAATNDIKMAKDGVAQTQDTSATVPTVTQLNVGHVAGSFQFSGNVGGIYGWTRNLSQPEVNAVTA